MKTSDAHPGPMRIPPGFSTVTSYFFVNDADQFISFLIHGLGGTEVLRHMSGPRIANAQVRVGGSTVMISEATGAFPAMPSCHYVYVEGHRGRCDEDHGGGEHAVQR